MRRPDRKYLFIVIEGADGVGKTSIAKALAERLNGQYASPMSTNLSGFKRTTREGTEISIKEYIDSLAYTSTKARFAFYLLAILESIPTIENMLLHSHVICDRFINSTICYHEVLDPDIKNTNVLPLITLHPDKEFLIDVSEEIHRQRLKTRQRVPVSGLEANFTFLRNVQLHFKSKGLDIVDTTGISVDDVVRKLYSGLVEDGLVLV